MQDLFCVALLVKAPFQLPENWLHVPAGNKLVVVLVESMVEGFFSVSEFTLWKIRVVASYLRF